MFLKSQLYCQASVFRRAHQKLASKFFCPYWVIEKIGSVAYKLHLPTGVQIHMMFHVSLLKKVMGKIIECSEELPPIDDDSVLVLEPDGIIDTRWLKRRGKLIKQSLVHWKKLPPEEAT